MTTIKDVAKHAKVSVTAVSYALNETGSISDETRKHILAVANELNYHPNAFAKNLKKQKTHIIGVFITSFGGAFYEEILEGIHDAIIQTDYELIVCPESWTTRKILSHRQVDGAIVFDWKVKNETIKKLASKKFPIVLMDRDLHSDYLFPLLLDNVGGAQSAFEHLYRQGARRVGFVAGTADAFDSRERKGAFLEEAAQHGVEVTCYEGDFTERSGRRVAQTIIESEVRPEAVFCANDQMAIGLMRGLAEQGVRVPEDIRVVGFDDMWLAKYLRPSLTTVGASRVEWGGTAANLLVEFLKNGTAFPEPFRLETQLIERGSSRTDR